MNKHFQRGKQFFANQMHREIFWLFFLALFIPTVITTVSLFYLIFNITAQELGIPEAIAANILPAAQKVTVILLVALPVTTVIILILAYKVTHRIVGPFDRVVRELDEHLKGTRDGHISLRKNDKFWPLVNRINTLLDKLRKS